MTVTELIFLQARERPAHPAVEDGDRVVTYAELTTLTHRCAKQLQARGIGSGDVVVLSLPESTEHIAVLLALARLGAVGLSADAKSPDIEKAKGIRDLAVKTAIVRDPLVGFLDLTTVPVAALFDDRGSGESSLDVPVPDDDAPLMVSQTSGTTGAPKRLLITHRQMIDRNQRTIASLGLTSADRYFQVPYLRFLAGRRRCLAMLMTGATVVLNHAETIADYGRWISERGISHVYFTPYHLRVMLSRAAGDTPLWPNLKIALGSAPVTPAERLLARRRLTPHLYEFYSVNEVGDIAMAMPADQDRYPGSVGRVLPGIEAEVVDENDVPLPTGQTGFIRFRGVHFPTEYLGDGEATTRRFRDGWLYPGDLAAVNDEGYIFFGGRADDIINNSGVKYDPAEVEAVLLSHPSVADAAVVGGPHPEFGEVSVAYIVRSAAVSAEELYNFCASKMDRYKAPRWVMFLAELPRVATGKPDKRMLKENFRRYIETKSGSS